MFTLPILPYEQSALEPYMSARTLEFHYGKHHQAYLDNLNKLIIGTEFENMSLVDIVVKTANNPALSAIFNNAAQSYNHQIFWQCLAPAETKIEPTAAVLDLINKSFGSLTDFYAQFKTAALGQFGSGWVWLVREGEVLKIMKTANANNPLTSGLKILLALDVWEHSYYLDYQNRRADFVEAVLHNLLNWKFVQDNL
ncbi:MAG: superoxide dismutase [Patescibacteria group bacterium]